MTHKVLVLTTLLFAGCSNAVSEINEAPEINSEALDTTAEHVEEIEIVTETQSLSTRRNDDRYFVVSMAYGFDGAPSYKEFFSEEDSLNRMREYIQEIKSTFDTVEVYEQDLYFEGIYTGDEKFIPRGNESNQIGIDFFGEEHVFSPINTFWLGEALYQEIDDYIVSGRNFTSDDFNIISPAQQINVILGEGYKGVYEIGDTIQVTHMQYPIALNVIGFLESGVEVEVLTFRNVLDNYIIMPFYDVNYTPIDAFNDFYQKDYYSQKMMQFIPIEETEEIAQLVPYHLIDDEYIPDERYEEIFNIYNEQVNVINEKYNLITLIAYANQTLIIKKSQ